MHTRSLRELFEYSRVASAISKLTGHSRLRYGHIQKSARLLNILHLILKWPTELILRSTTVLCFEQEHNEQNFQTRFYEVAPVTVVYHKFQANRSSEKSAWCCFYRLQYDVSVLLSYNMSDDVGKQPKKKIHGRVPMTA